MDKILGQEPIMLLKTIRLKMKINTWLYSICLFCLFTGSFLDARGAGDDKGHGGGSHGGGSSHGSGGSHGGGGSHGRAGGGSRITGRTPSMSRAAARPNVARPQGGSAHIDRHQGRQFDAGQARQQVHQFAQQHHSNLQRRSGSQPHFDRKNVQHWNNTGNRVRDNRHINDNRNNWFNQRFWNKHGGYPNYYNRGYDGWRGASWDNVNGWLPYGWSSPLYYDEGYPYDYDDGNYDNYQPPSITTNTYNVYNTNVQPAQETEQPQQVVDENWLPLGVFAITQDGTGLTTPNMFVQLALAKDGTISGTYYNSTTNTTYPVTGIVDQSTQSAIFKAANSPNSPVMQTGIYNLTQDQSPVLIHFNTGQNQNWLLVRINQ